MMLRATVKVLKESSDTHIFGLHFFPRQHILILTDNREMNLNYLTKIIFI